MIKSNWSIIALAGLFLFSLFLNYWDKTSSSNGYTIYVLGALLIQGIIQTIYTRYEEKKSVSTKTTVIVESIMIIISLALIIYLLVLSIEPMMKFLFLMYQVIFLGAAIKQLVKAKKARN